MNILIAGGAGYIGSHMAKLLHEAGHAVTVLDNLSTGHRQAVQWGEWVEGALQDRELVTRLLRDRGIGAVMHFAANSLVGESVADPYLYYQNNACATLTLLQAMREAGVQRFIFSSTASVYGDPQSSNISEEHPRVPISPYGKSKLLVEYMIEDAAHAYGLRAIALRYFNAAGADSSGLIGEAHQPETHLIPRLLRRAAGERLDLRINGTDYATPDGSCIRDYVHVSDLADAHLRALQYAADHAGFHAFNLGNGNGYSVLEVVRTVETVIGRSLDIPRGPRRSGDPAVLVASSRKARDLLGWKPQRADLEQIVSDAWRWHRKPAY